MGHDQTGAPALSKEPETRQRTYLSPQSWCRSRCRRSSACSSWRARPWSAAWWGCRAWWCPRSPQGCSTGWWDLFSPPQGNTWTQSDTKKLWSMSSKTLFYFYSWFKDLEIWCWEITEGGGLFLFGPALILPVKGEIVACWLWVSVKPLDLLTDII